MKLVILAKSVVAGGNSFRDGKTKYFADHIQAAFHIIAYKCAYKLNIEPCLAVEVNGEYFKVNEVTEIVRDDIMKLPRNQIHNVYRFDEYSYREDSSYCISSHIPTGASCYGDDKNKPLFISENGKLFWVEKEKYTVESIPSEYKDIQDQVQNALTLATTRNLTESQNNVRLFQQKQEDIMRHQAELERMRIELNAQGVDLDYRSDILGKK